MTKNKLPKAIMMPLLLGIGSLLVIGAIIYKQSTASSLPVISNLSKPSEESFLAPGRDWPSEKKVEDYFVEHLRMTPQEAQEVRSKPGDKDRVMLRLRENTTLEGLLGNLEYYGFVRDKETLRYALEHTTDALPGKANPLKIGDNTIDTWSSYQISENMTAWEIADQLLNQPTYFSFDEYNYMFMP